MPSENLSVSDFNGRIYMAKHAGTIDSSLDYSTLRGGWDEGSGPLYLKIVVSKTSSGRPLSHRCDRAERRHKPPLPPNLLSHLSMYYRQVEARDEAVD